MLLSQLGYIGQLFSSNTARVTAASNVASYYILNNLFVLAFTLLWVRNFFWGAEIIDIANLLNQAIVYWKHHDLPQIIHLPAVAGPYAWTLTTLFWNGAVAVGGDNGAKRIAANVFIWVVFIFGQGHITYRNDASYGYSLSLLTLCKLSPIYCPRYSLARVCDVGDIMPKKKLIKTALALKQFSLKIISLQWIFAFVIFAVFFVSSLHSTASKYYQRNFFFRKIVEPESTDRERQPLLRDE